MYNKLSMIKLDCACKRHHLAYSAAYYHKKGFCNILAKLINDL